MLELPIIPNPPSTDEDDISLKPLTNTDTSKDLSDEVLELIDDDQKKVASPFKTPPHGSLEDDDEDLTPTNKKGDDKEGYEDKELSENEDNPEIPQATNAEDDARRTRLNLSALTTVRKNAKVLSNFWELITKAAQKMKWSYEELDWRYEKNSLFRNNECRLAKNLIREHKNIQIGYPKIYSPEGNTNVERLNFAMKLGY